MRQLFISYAREHKPDVDELVRDLDSLGYQTWVDSSLRGGQTWWEEILRRIADSDAFMVIVSRETLSSIACKRELEWGLALNKPVLPVAVGRLPDALPRALSMRHIIEYSKSRREAVIALARALGNLPTAPPPPKPLPEPPPAPLSYLSDLVDQVAQPEALTHEQQRQVLIQLEPALRSADAEERRGGRYVLEMFSKRDDLYADVEHNLAELGIADRDTQPPSEVTAEGHDERSPTPRADRTRRSRTRWLIAGSAGLAITVAIVIAVVLAWPRSGPRPHPLDSILLSGAEINTIMDDSDMKTVQGKGALKSSSSELLEVSPQECMGALYPGMEQTYQDSGEKDGTWHVLEDPPGGLNRAGDGNHHFVDQTVAAFPPNTDRALAFVQGSANQWKACTGQTVTVTYTDNRKYTWTVGNLTGKAPTITQSYTLEGGHGYACQRVLRAVFNIVIDVKACGHPITDEASRIANKIAASVTQAPHF